MAPFTSVLGEARERGNGFRGTGLKRRKPVKSVPVSQGGRRVASAPRPRGALERKRATTKKRAETSNVSLATCAYRDSELDRAISLIGKDRSPQATFLLARTLSRLGRPNDALAELTALHATALSDRQRAEACMLEAAMLTRLCDFDRARTVLARALSLARSVRHLELTLDCRYYISVWHIAAKQVDNAIVQNLRAIRLAEASGLPEDSSYLYSTDLMVCRHLTSLSCAYAGKGEYDKWAYFAEESLQRYDRSFTRDTWAEALFLVNVAHVFRDSDSPSITDELLVRVRHLPNSQHLNGLQVFCFAGRRTEQSQSRGCSGSVAPPI